MTTETEWCDLPTLQDVARAQYEEWEIECRGTSGSWCSWNKVSWYTNLLYRGRPRQPEMKEVKIFCWMVHGMLEWCIESKPIGSSWIRQPHLDTIAKIPV